MNYIKVQDIYNKIITEQGWEDDEESKSRLLRKKFQFIMEKILYCKKDDFKVKGKYEIPILDAPIVKCLLIESLDEESMVCDWFNNSLNLNESAQVVLLYNILKPVVMEAEMCGFTDYVTTQEWLAVIRTVIDYESAKKTSKMQQLLEDFRESSVAQNHQICIGEMIMSDEDGNRKVVMSAKNTLNEEIDKIIDCLVSKIKSQDEYFDIINCLLEKFISKVELESEKNITSLAKIKRDFELDSARCLCTEFNDDLDKHNKAHMASEYVAYYNNIYKYLRTKPEVVERIEKEVKTQELIDFFHMSK